MNLKKFILLTFLISFCGGSAEPLSAPVEEETIVTTSTSSTTTTVPETTTTVPETTTTTIASGVNIEPRIEIVCEPETREDEFLGFKFTIYTGSSELEVLNIVSWLDSSRADDLFIYDNLPAPNETKELMYWVDPNFTKYEMEMLVMDKNDNFVTDYCLWSKGS
jgi:hypothetical protein